MNKNVIPATWVISLASCGMTYSYKWHDSLTSSAEDSCFPFSLCLSPSGSLWNSHCLENRQRSTYVLEKKDRALERDRQLDIDRQTVSQTDRQSVVRTFIERVTLQLTLWLDWPNGDVGLERGKQRLSSHDWQSRCTVKKCQSHGQNKWTNFISLLCLSLKDEWGIACTHWANTVRPWRTYLECVVDRGRGYEKRHAYLKKEGFKSVEVPPRTAVDFSSKAYKTLLHRSGCLQRRMVSKESDCFCRSLSKDSIIPPNFLCRRTIIGREKVQFDCPESRTLPDCVGRVDWTERNSREFPSCERQGHVRRQWSKCIEMIESKFFFLKNWECLLIVNLSKRSKTFKMWKTHRT